MATCAGIVGCPSTFVNVGKVETNGIESALAWNFARNLSWFNTLTLNDSKYKSDYYESGVLQHASGKQVVDAPKVMFNTEVGYDDKTWFGRVGGKYTDKRYYTYLNDGQVPAFWVWNLGAGYKRKSLGGLRDFTAQINITNLLDKKYYSTIGSNGFVTSDPSGMFATLLEGAPRQVFLTVSGKY